MSNNKTLTASTAIVAIAYVLNVLISYSELQYLPGPALATLVFPFTSLAWLLFDPLLLLALVTIIVITILLIKLKKSKIPFLTWLVLIMGLWIYWSWLVTGFHD